MKIGLCLGGGGARGFAHIGVLKALNERGMEPSAISGCSMGGLLGALLAAGVSPAEMREKFLSIEPVRILDQTRGGGLIGHKGVDRQIEKHLPRDFADLKVPLAVTAVDVQDGKLVVLRKGPLLPALRATSALPGLFTPVHHEGRVLIDGGLLNNLPDAAAQSGIDVSEARDLWRGYLAQHLERPENLVELAELQVTNHQTARADSTFNRAIARETRYSGSYLNYADFLRRQNRVAEARAVLARGIKTATEPAALHHSLGLLLIGEKDLPGALVQLRLASEAQPASARFSYVYAVALHDAGQVTESLDVLAKALDRHPWDQASLQAMVVYSLEQKQFQRALAPAENLVRLMPEDRQAQQVLQQVRAELR